VLLPIYTVAQLLKRCAILAVDFLGVIRTLIIKFIFQLDEEIFRNFSVTAYLELSSLYLVIFVRKETIHRAKNVYSCSSLLSVYRQPNLLSKRFIPDVDSASVNVGNVASVSDIPAASVFTVEVSRYVIYV
jgi:hypothetical protein